MPGSNNCEGRVKSELSNNLGMEFLLGRIKGTKDKPILKNKINYVFTPGRYAKKFSIKFCNKIELNLEWFNVNRPT